MNKWTLLFVLLTPILLNAQKSISLKKKYLGKYKGSIPAYQIQSDNALLHVGESAIYLELTADKIDLKIGNKKNTGTYRVLFKTRVYYLVEARIDGESYAERFLVYVRGKKIVREGLYPQPNAELKKY